VKLRRMSSRHPPVKTDSARRVRTEPRFPLSRAPQSGSERPQTGLLVLQVSFQPTGRRSGASRLQTAAATRCACFHLSRRVSNRQKPRCVKKTRAQLSFCLPPQARFRGPWFLAFARLHGQSQFDILNHKRALERASRQCWPRAPDNRAECRNQTCRRMR